MILHFVAALAKLSIGEVLDHEQHRANEQFRVIICHNLVSNRQTEDFSILATVEGCTNRPPLNTCNGLLGGAEQHNLDFSASPQAIMEIIRLGQRFPRNWEGFDGTQLPQTPRSDPGR